MCALNLESGNQVFPYKSIMIASLLYIILADQRFHRNTPVSDIRGNFKWNCRHSIKIPPQIKELSLVTSFFVFLKKILITYFRERGREGERGEKHG